MTEFPTAAHDSIVELLYLTSLGARGGVIVLSTHGRCELSWREVAALACRAADGLARFGIQSGDRVALAAGNSLEWIVADFAVQILGGVVVPLHPGLRGSLLAWQIAHSGSRLLIASGQDIVAKLNVLPADLRTVSFAPAACPHTGKLFPLWKDLIAAGSELAGHARWQGTRRSITPQTLASIVYTSGTSGEPRGVMLTQRNLAANAIGTISSFGRRPDDCRLNALPFSHAFGRMSDLYVSLVNDTRLALVGSPATLISDAQQVKPTLMVVVPLLLGRLRQAAITQSGAVDRSAVQKLLGGRLRGFICGGAPLADDVREYFAEQSIPVYEGYGLTEASPVVAASSTGHGSRPRSVGMLLPHTEARIAGDGELLIRGPQVMAGYWQDEEATRAALRDDWLHTGDLGSVDADGFLYLNGRKKEFIALASGKKIWPAAIEARFADDPEIAQLLVVGDGQPALGALVTLRASDADAGGKTELNSSANQKRILDHLALRLAGCPAEEQIRRVWILAEPWTAERAEVTPKQTLRRAVITARYADYIRQMFSAGD